jgi:hypothetical protein
MRLVTSDFIEGEQFLGQLCDCELLEYVRRYLSIVIIQS